MNTHSNNNYTCLFIGRVLNRFSKDAGFVDSLLPYISVEFLAVSYNMYREISLLKVMSFYQGLCLASRSYCLRYKSLVWLSKVCEQETKELFHLKAMQKCFHNVHFK